MSKGLGLDLLFAKLHAEGFRVGVDEELRVLHVVSAVSAEASVALAAKPGAAVPLAELRPLVASVIVKSTQDRARFEETFDAWAELEALARRRVDERATPRAFSSRVAQNVRLRRLTGSVTTDAPRRSVSRDRRMGWLVAISALGVLLVGIGLRLAARSQPTAPLPSASQSTALPTSSVERAIGSAVEAAPSGSAAVQLASRETRVAQIESLPRPGPVRRSAPWAGLVIFALGTTIGIWRRYARRSWLPAPERAPGRAGLPYVLPALPVLPGGPPLRLLERADQEALVWGIGRFVSEEPTRHLDVSTTVAATARRGGVPELRFQRARHDREVWLWIDESVGTTRTEGGSSLRRYADEIARSLSQAGLEVERAWFHGVPDELWSDSGPFTPLEVDERRDAALVAILTDGQQLARQMAAENQRPSMEALFRVLAGFPNLAFVDFGRAAHGLEALLAPRELKVLEPEALPGFLGGCSDRTQRAARSLSHDLVGDTRAWAATLALAPFPVEEETAFALRDELELEASPWLLDTLHAKAQGPGGRLEWTPACRAALLRWLREVSAFHAAEEPCLLGQALRFWKCRLEQENQQRQKREPGEPWKDTPAEQRLLLDRALLDLWDEPESAIFSLYRLHGNERAHGPLRDLVHDHLAILAPSDSKDPEAVTLPWKWQDRSAIARVMLAEMGFAGSSPSQRGESLKRSGRLYIALGVAIAIAGLAGITAIVRAKTAPSTAGFEFERGDVPALGWARMKPTEDGAVIDVGQPGYWKEPVAVRGAGARVSWKTATVPCRETVPGVGEVWRCGTREAKRPEDWAERTEVVLVDASSSDETAQELALALLDSGSCDRVIWGTSNTAAEVFGARKDRGIRVDRPSELTEAARVEMAFSPSSAFRLELRIQAPATATPAAAESATIPVDERSWTRVTAPSWAKLTDGLRFSGIRTVSETWRDAVVQEPARQAVVRLQGIGELEARREISNPIPMVWVEVWVEGGEFMMGSDSSDTDAKDDEKPPHRVKLSGFWIGKREVSNLEYRRFDPKHEGEDNLPVTSVSWDDAKEYCESLKLELPTEAEWEYAARGKEGRRYPWGNQPPDEKRAVFYDSATKSRSGPDPVDSHPEGAGPFGTLNQAGNVWEWVADCYDAGAYAGRAERAAKEAVQDPYVDKTGCSIRVLRGGAWSGDPQVLRSAFRFRGDPDVRFRYVGFRCVRGSRRQPAARLGTRQDLPGVWQQPWPGNPGPLVLVSPKPNVRAGLLFD